MNLKPQAMISQPMRGLSRDKIERNRSEAVQFLQSKGYEVVPTQFQYFDVVEESTKNINIAFIAKAINALSKCDAIYFCKGWNDADGCMIEHTIAQTYGNDNGMEIFYEESK